VHGSRALFAHGALGVGGVRRRHGRMIRGEGDTLGDDEDVVTWWDVVGCAILDTDSDDSISQHSTDDPRTIPREADPSVNFRFRAGLSRVRPTREPNRISGSGDDALEMTRPTRVQTTR